MYDDLLTENDVFVQRFLSSNYFAYANVRRNSISSLTWEQRGAPRPHGMVLYENIADSSTGSRRSTMTSCPVVISSLDDAIKAIAADDSATYGEVEQDLVGPNLLVHAEVLETLRPRTKEKPDEYVGLKHVAYTSVLDDRVVEDFVLVETTGKCVDRDGFQYAYKVLRSVDLNQFNLVAPGLQSVDDHDEMTSLRGQLHSLVLILSETSAPGVLRMQLWVDVDVTKSPSTQFVGGLSSLHDSLSLALRYRSLIESFFHDSAKGSSAISQMFTKRVPATNLVPIIKAREKRCQLCERKVGLFVGKKHHCGICRIVCCSTCSKSTDFHAWKLCTTCFDRNDSLFSRSIIAKLASSSLSKLSFLAKRTANSAMAPSHRHSSHTPSDRERVTRSFAYRMSQPELFDQPPALQRATTAPTATTTQKRAPPPPIPTMTTKYETFTTGSSIGRRPSPLDSPQKPREPSVTTMNTPPIGAGLVLIEDEWINRLSSVTWRSSADGEHSHAAEVVPIQKLPPPLPPKRRAAMEPQAVWNIQL